jgi:hypothetical protein
MIGKNKLLVKLKDYHYNAAYKSKIGDKFFTHPFSAYEHKSAKRKDKKK